MDTPLKTYAKSLGIIDGYTSIIKFDAPLLGYSKLSKDSNTFPFWRLVIDSWDTDAKDYWDKDQVILNHLFTPDSISMHKSKFENYIKSPGTVITNSFDDLDKIENTVQDKIENESKDTEILNYVFHMPVADGHATYKVVKHTKVSVWVELRKFGDGYMDRFLGVEKKISISDFNKLTGFGRPKLASLVSHW